MRVLCVSGWGSGDGRCFVSVCRVGDMTSGRVLLSV